MKRRPHMTFSAQLAHAASSWGAESGAATGGPVSGIRPTQHRGAGLGGQETPERCGRGGDVAAVCPQHESAVFARVLRDFGGVGALPGDLSLRQAQDACGEDGACHVRGRARACWVAVGFGRCCATRSVRGLLMSHLVLKPRENHYFCGHCYLFPRRSILEVERLFVEGLELRCEQQLRSATRTRQTGSSATITPRPLRTLGVSISLLRTATHGACVTRPHRHLAPGVSTPPGGRWSCPHHDRSLGTGGRVRARAVTARRPSPAASSGSSGTSRASSAAQRPPADLALPRCKDLTKKRNEAT